VKVSLVMVKADGSAKDFPINRLPLVIGRDPSVKFRIPISAVSRRHCEIFSDDGDLLVRDMGSSNGTYVNGLKKRETELASGDLLTIGGIVFVVRIDGAPARIDAKDCYMAGLVSDELNTDDDEDELLGRGTGRPLAGLGNVPPGGDLSDLLKDLDFSDEDDDKKKAS